MPQETVKTGTANFKFPLLDNAAAIENAARFIESQSYCWNNMEQLDEWFLLIINHIKPNNDSFEYKRALNTLDITKIQEALKKYGYIGVTRDTRAATTVRRCIADENEYTEMVCLRKKEMTEISEAEKSKIIEGRRKAANLRRAQPRAQHC